MVAFVHLTPSLTLQKVQPFSSDTTGYPLFLSYIRPRLLAFRTKYWAHSCIICNIRSVVSFGYLVWNVSLPGRARRLVGNFRWLRLALPLIEMFILLMYSGR